MEGSTQEPVKPTVFDVLEYSMSLISDHVADIHRHIGLLGNGKTHQFNYEEASWLIAQKANAICRLTYQKFFTGGRVDSHTGTTFPSDAPGLEWYWTIYALLYLELIRQSSVIHTGRGKMQDYQYAQAKKLITGFFAAFKGNPDSLPPNPNNYPYCLAESKVLCELKLGHPSKLHRGGPCEW